MTDTSVVEPATESASEQKPVVQLDEFLQSFKDRLLKQVEQHNVLANDYKATTGDEQAILDGLRANYDTPEANQIRAAIATIKERLATAQDDLDAIVKPLVAEKLNDLASGGEGAKTAYEESLKKIRTSIKYLESEAEGSTADLPNIVTVRKSGESGGTSGSGRRVRNYDVYVDGAKAEIADAKGVMRSNLAAGAKVIGVKTADLQELFFGEVKSENRDEWPAEVKFTVAYNDKLHEVRCERVAANADEATEVAATEVAANTPDL